MNSRWPPMRRSSHTRFFFTSHLRKKYSSNGTKNTGAIRSSKIPEKKNTKNNNAPSSVPSEPCSADGSAVSSVDLSGVNASSQPLHTSSSLLSLCCSFFLLFLVVLCLLF